MPSNIQLNWIKRFYTAKNNKKFGDKVKDYKDKNGLHFIGFDFVAGDLEITIPILVETLSFSILSGLFIL